MLSSPHTHVSPWELAQERKMAVRLRSQTIPHPMKTHPFEFKDIAFTVFVYLYAFDTLIIFSAGFEWSRPCLSKKIFYWLAV